MSISLCNDQMLLFKHKVNVYIAPTLRAYQTFHGRKFIQAFTSEGKWIGAKIGFVAAEPAGTANRGWIDADWFRVTK